MESINQKQLIRFIAPPLIVLSNILIFQLGKLLWGATGGYLAGFCCYWIGWCFLFSIWFIGFKNLKSLFQLRRHFITKRLWIILPLLLIFPIVTFFVSFLPYFREAGIGIILVALVFAVINGTLEELLWRGALIAAYPTNKWGGYIYPTLFFGAWHIAPELILPNPLSGGPLSFIGGALVMGFAWGWIAWRSHSILLTTIAHVLTNFFGFVGFIYLNWIK